MRTLVPFALAVLIGCEIEDPKDTSTDIDGDGVTADGGDCDDENAAIYPDADELCDGVDNNCDGVIDTDAIDLSVWYVDADGDGYGLDGSTTEACEQPSGHAASGGDCQDSDGAINPALTSSVTASTTTATA